MFKKILMWNYAPGDFAQQYWDRFDRVSEERVLLPADSGDLDQHLSDSDCLLVKLGMTVDSQMMDRSPNLKYVGVFGTGYGRIDTGYAASKNITVCNVTGYSTQSVAEFGVAALLEQLREVERAKDEGRRGNYTFATFMGSELRSKVVGVIGLGSIGARFAEMVLQGFGADVRYWSRSRKQQQEDMGIRYQEVEPLLREADIVSLHLAANPETIGFMSGPRIQLLKPGAILLNLSPTELIDQPALESRLAIGDITFIFDHPNELSSERAQQLAKYERCVIYPPIANITHTASADRQDGFVGNLENYIKGTPTNKVN